MSLRYIFGGSGAGKSSFILTDITECSISGSSGLNKLILIVPEQFSLESEKKLLALSGTGCIIEPQVLGFNRLAYYVFSKTGKPRGIYLDETGKVMLLRKIIINLGEKLSYYGSVSGKQGFMENLVRIINEFGQYGVTVEALETKLGVLEPKRDLYTKLQDLILILKTYTAYLRENFVSTEEMFDIMTDRIYRTDILDNCEVWIDSFNGFTPQELKTITALMKKAARVTIALLNDEDKISYPKNDFMEFTDPYYEIKATINKLSRLAEASNVKIEPPIFLPGAKRFDNFPELDFIRKNFFLHFGSVYPNPVKNFRITRANNRYAEVTYVAENIIELLRENNFRYSDIAILTGSLNDYEKIIRSVFRKHGIPIFIDSVVDILSHPLAELVRAAIDILISGRSYESVFRFLKTGLVARTIDSSHLCRDHSDLVLEKDDIDYLEDFVLAYGISGYKWDLEINFEPGQFDRERIIHCKNAFLNVIEPLMKDIKPNDEYTVKEITGRLYGLLTNLDISGTLTAWSDEMSKSGNNEMSRRHSQILGKVCAVLDTMIDILGDERVSLKQYAKILDAGLYTMDMGVIPPSLEQVLAGDIERTRLPEVKALFLIGVNDGVLPRIPENNGLLSDDDRIALITEGMELAPDSRRKCFNENTLIYIALCKPNERLYMTYAAGNSDGKPMRPSSLIARVLHMLPSLTETEAASEHRISVPVPMFTKTTEAMFSGKQISKTEKIIYNWFLDRGGFKERLNRISNGCVENKREIKLSGDTVEKLYGGIITTSVSRLETYNQCPFAYFLRYNLNARERKIYEARPVDIGSLFHLILELFTQKIGLNGWRVLDSAAIDELVDECIAESLVNYDVLLSTSRYRYIVTRVIRIVKKSIHALTEHIKNGDFEVFATELDFKYECAGRGLAITGRIDRIDVMELDGRIYVKIIDYKSGGKRFLTRDIYSGEQLQLITYLDVILKEGLKALENKKMPTEYLPGGVFYFGIDDPIINYKSGIDPSQLAYEKYKMSGLVLAESDVVIGMDKTIGKKSDIIPVGINDSRFSARSSVATAEEFEQLRTIANENIDKIANQILSGVIDIAPRGSNACEYCEYSAVCRLGI